MKYPDTPELRKLAATRDDTKAIYYEAKRLYKKALVGGCPVKVGDRVQSHYYNLRKVPVLVHHVGVSIAGGIVLKASMRKKDGDWGIRTISIPLDWVTHLNGEPVE